MFGGGCLFVWFISCFVLLCFVVLFDCLFVSGRFCFVFCLLFCDLVCFNWLLVCFLIVFRLWFSGLFAVVCFVGECLGFMIVVLSCWLCWVASLRLFVFVFACGLLFAC